MSISNRVQARSAAPATPMFLAAAFLMVAVTLPTFAASVTITTRGSVNSWPALVNLRSTLTDREQFERAINSAPGLVRLREAALTERKIRTVNLLHHKLSDGYRTAKFASFATAWEGGHTILQWAARGGYTEVVEFLVSVPGLLVNEVRGTLLQRTALHWASSLGHVSIVELLLTAPGIDVNARDEQGSTPLHLAALFRHADVVRVLAMAAGIDLNALGDAVVTPLQIALDSLRTNETPQDRDIVETLVGAGGLVYEAPAHDDATPHDVSALYWAIVNPDLHDVVEVLTAMEPVDVNFGGRSKKTPLYYAVRNGYRDVVQVLVRAGADVNIHYPLYLAVDRGFEDIAEVLATTPGLRTTTRRFEDAKQLAIVRGFSDLAALMTRVQRRKNLQRWVPCVSNDCVPNSHRPLH
ncbi:Ankyrin repeat domain-containing protein [Plasmodiophora brassicae]